MARAYLRRAELLVELGEQQAAVAVYRELAGREDLRGRSEPTEARLQLRRLGEGVDG